MTMKKIACPSRISTTATIATITTRTKLTTTALFICYKLAWRPLSSLSSLLSLSFLRFAAAADAQQPRLASCLANRRGPFSQQEQQQHPLDLSRLNRLWCREGHNRISLLSSLSCCCSSSSVSKTTTATARPAATHLSSSSSSIAFLGQHHRPPSSQLRPQVFLVDLSNTVSTPLPLWFTRTTTTTTVFPSLHLVNNRRHYRPPAVVFMSSSTSGTEFDSVSGEREGAILTNVVNVNENMEPSCVKEGEDNMEPAIPKAETNDDDATATTLLVDVAANVAQVRANMAQALASRLAKGPLPASSQQQHNVRLVAVSKTKPVSLLQQAYDEGQVRIFGENYIQELVDKVSVLPSDIQWHFIGTLQSNKIKLLLQPFLLSNSSSSLNRLVVETVSSLKLAQKLQKALDDHYFNNNQQQSSSQDERGILKIFVQVNTSGEETKGGVSPVDVVTLCQDIVRECPSLQLLGLMTIGAPTTSVRDDNDNNNNKQNDDFDTLVQCRRDVAMALSLPDETSLELSMGMSNDYELAIAKGSTNIRVGSTIFGARNYSNVKKT